MDKPTYLLLICFWLIAGAATQEQKKEDQDGISNIEKLKKKLFEKYDREVRPAPHHSNVTVIEFGMTPKYLIGLDEEQSLFKLDVWLEMSWVDERLSWNPQDYEGLQLLHVGDHMVWQPDVAVYNYYAGNVDPTGRTHVVITSAGTVFFVPPAMLTTRCPIKVISGSYPMDTVECDIVFGSWNADSTRIDFQLIAEKVYTDSFVNSNPRWEMLLNNLTITRGVLHYSCCDVSYITIVAKFLMKRRLPPEIQVVRGPCILVMALTLAMFLIPVHSGRKPLLGSTLLLALIQMIVYAASATRSPRAPTFAVALLESTVYATVSAVLLEVLVANMGSLLKCCAPPALIVRTLAGPAGKCIAVCPKTPKDGQSGRLQFRDDASKIDLGQYPRKDQWDLVASAVERLLFVIYLATFVLLLQTSEEEL